jgi:chemotaxis protein CheD
MAHIALPRSKTNPERAKETPGYFADTGLDLLFEQMAELGCDPTGKGMVVKLAGGAKILDMDSTFDIGKKNALAIKKHLWKRGLGPVSEDLGGNKSRTVVLDAGSGCVTISSSTGESWEI